MSGQLLQLKQELEGLLTQRMTAFQKQIEREVASLREVAA
jgi:hypothetical protein